MYNLTKAYKSKAQAVNAIRLTANNKGWRVLTTDEAAAHVWPQAEGFEVSNATLNLALGFITEAEASIAELNLKPTKDELAIVPPKKALQAPSKLEQDKKAAKKAPKTDNDVTPFTFPGTKQTRCNVVNDARRPLRGKTLLVWDTAEALFAKTGNVPTLKEVYAELLATDAGFNKTTAGIQFYACRTYNGWEK